jgi:RNA polymerase sigma-70 factor (ECF subfamily)
MPSSRQTTSALTPTDAELVEASLAEEDGAFERLVRRYKGLLTLVSYRQTGDALAAEDVAQEAFVRAFLSLSSLEDPERFKSWLVRIATNIARDHLRRKKRGHMSMEDSRFDERNILGTATGGVSREMMAIEERLQILDAIRELPEDYELPVVMRYVEGLPYKEMSARMGVREDTLRKRVHRANTMLRDKLKGITSAE